MNLYQALKMSCKDATYLHEKKKDGKITTPERLGLWWHLVICKFCSFFIKQTDYLEKMSHKFSANAEERINLTIEQKDRLQKGFEKQTGQ
jgi:hypothetical protein